jgi:hypothetical protein
MYTPRQLLRGLRRGLETPAYVARELNRLYHRRLYTRSFNPFGQDVVAADWDNLLILDACRYDLFESEHQLPGRLESRLSRGSHTVEFLEGNFHGRELLDTVYVTASPQLYRWRDRIDVRFHDVVEVWREEGWNDDHGTVMPRTTTEHAMAAAERYPDKRLVVHYVQPHYPFVEAPELSTDHLRNGADGRDIWGQLLFGDLDRSPAELWDAYRRNFQLVQPAVEELLAALQGRSVVTADHGNMFAERAYPIPIREWGHPPGVYTRQLVEVPWLVHERGARKAVVAEDPAAAAGEEEPSAAVLTDRLRHLGYVE